MNLHKYTSEDLKEACRTSLSKREVLIKLNVAPAGGNYYTLTKAIKTFEVDVSHFTGQLWSKGKVIGPRRDLKEYLKKDTTSITSHSLRLRLIREGIFTHVCSKCKGTEWLSKPIPLELEHKDGDHSNNELSNLELLCPNCHAQTPTYRGKNKKK